MWFPARSRRGQSVRSCQEGFPSLSGAHPASLTSRQFAALFVFIRGLDPDIVLCRALAAGVTGVKDAARFD
jgi:hypothetical protein